MFCENCGTHLEGEEKFCIKCGHPVSVSHKVEIEGQETTAVGTIKAVGMAAKTKVTMGLAVALGVAAIGTFVVMGIGVNKKDEADVNLIEQTAEEEGFIDKEEPIIEANEQQEKNEIDIINNFQDIKLTFPENFESWDTTSRNLAGENRYLYAGGHKITMPTTVGEWEELLSTRFVKIPEFFAGGATNYTHNRVCVRDENNIEYVFRIDTTCYEPMEGDLKAELKQLRETSVIGLEIHWEDGGSWGINSKLGSYISLIPQGSMFEGNVEEIKKNLCKEYGIESINGNKIEIDRFQDGYSFSWGLADDGMTGTLYIDYVPDNLLAFKKFFDGTMRIDNFDWTFEDLYINLGISLIDVTNDGIDELILWTDETGEGNPNPQHDILTYNQETGTLNMINYHGTEVIRNNGVLVDIKSYYRDGTCKNYQDRLADYTHYQFYVYNQYGSKLKLVDLKYSNCHYEYFINNKRVSLETYEECSKMYSAFDAIIYEPDISNRNKFLKESMSTYYVEREEYKKDHNDNSGLKVYDDSLISETGTGLEYWQEKYLSLIQQFFNQEGYLEDGYAAWIYEPLAPKEEWLTFNVKDINNDGLPELFLAPYTDEQYLSTPNMFIPKETWEDSMLGAIDGIGFPMGEIVVHIPNIDTDIGVYTYDGNNLSLVKEFYCVGEADGQEVRYYISENGLTREISKNEFDRLVNIYKINDYNRIENKNLTIDNLEEAFGIRIHYFGNEYMIYDKDILAPAVNSVKESIDQPLAVSAEMAYEEFLAGNRSAIVDSKYGTSVDNQIVLLNGEKISLSEMKKRVLDTCYQTYGEENQERSLDLIQYSYIDCGSDGEQELVIRFQGLNYYAPDDDSNCVCVLKYRDGQLYITYSSLSWARSITTLYKNGVILSAGSGGAAISYNGMDVLDSNGIKRNIYSSTIFMDLYEYNPEAYEAVLANTSAVAMDIIVYNINGGKYRTAEIYNEDGLDYSKEMAQQYLDKCVEYGDSFIELDVIEQKINKLRERYNVSDKIEGEEIIWQNL
ncbi:MAG: zinc ribbon domain-containing protein [Lachnospiraceae bacterium]|nr:zinc ribbon domain-containing protein [Lachnospiraceae bacterium]